MQDLVNESSKRVIVTVTENGNPVRKIFDGYWILGDGTLENSEYLFNHKCDGYSVAVTRQGGVIVIEHFEDGADECGVYDTYLEFCEANRGGLDSRYGAGIQSLVDAEFGVIFQTNPTPVPFLM